MLKITTLETAGLRQALHAMRNPFDSWDKSDSDFAPTFNVMYGKIVPGEYEVGENDRNLSVKLQQAGPEHCKHLRQIVVWADISGPLYWHKEMDTYRTGVEKVSCSTMHTIAKKPFELSDFSDDHLTVRSSNLLQMIIDTLNDYRARYQEEKDPGKKKLYWWQLIQLLPTSYNQTRTYMFSYAALRSIYRQREGHRLDEWYQFRKWCEGLPNAWMITE